MALFLGIDIGGTNMKFGIVNKQGEILKKVKHLTNSFRESGDFIENFIDKVQMQLEENPTIKKVGIASPGHISYDRKTVVASGNLPELVNKPFIEKLEARFPNHEFALDNDANAAALGEFYFSKRKNAPEDYIFLTLGTGLGSAAVLKGEIFKGGDGNAMEAAFVMTSKGKFAEDCLGKKAIVSRAKGLYKKGSLATCLNDETILDSKAIVKAAQKGDKLATRVFEKIGKYLGEAIVSTVHILDIKTIYIGGGVSKIFHILEGSMQKVIEERFSHYYADKMTIELATLGNDAGIIGAAALVFKK